MFRLTRTAVVLALAGSLLLPACAAAQAVGKTKRKPRPSAARKALLPEPPEPPAPPPPPPTPEQMPPVAPEVTYQNGQLTIVAQNSLLRDILSAVRERTGAILEAPPNLGNERAVVHLGPGAPRDVLAGLLQGSRFDYILVGSPQNASAVQRIILTARSGAPAGPSVAGSAPPSSVTPGGTMARPGVRSMPPDQVEATDADAEEQPEPAPPAVPDQPAPPQVPDQQAPPAIPQLQQSPGPPQVKTPEQLLQELQRMQQLQREQQQQPQKPPPQ